MRVGAALAALLALSPGPVVTGEDIGLLPGTTETAAMSVNASGLAVGFGVTVAGAVAFQRAEGSGPAALPSTSANARANGVNASGVVVGSASVAGFTRAVRWTPAGGFGVLDAASGNPFDVAHAVADGGTTVGSARYLVATGPSVYQIHATRWTASGPERLVVPGATSSEALAINTAGDAAGYWRDGTGATRAFSWTASGGAVEIPRPTGYALAVATGINDAGAVVGYVRNASSTDTRAFQWTSAGGLVLLPLHATFPYAIAYDINNTGEVAGVVRTGSGAFHAAVFMDGAWLDLDPSSSENSLARSLNDDLAVVGYRSVPLPRAHFWRVTRVTPNRPPVVASLAGPGQADEGQAVAFTSEAFDPDGDPLLYSWDFGDGHTGSGGPGASHAYADDGPYTVRLTVRDVAGLEGSAQTTVTVVNVAPSVGSIALPEAPVAVGQTVSLTATFTDPGVDTHAAVVHWGDVTTSATVVNGAVHASRAFSTPGVFTVHVEVTDDDGGVGSRSSTLDHPAYVVVYDPTAGHVTGGGWIDSPVGACAGACAAAGGKATFGFVARYRPNSSVPEGNTEFRVQAGDWSFRSTSYGWLTMTADVARFQGQGQVNGKSGYEFLLTAIKGSGASKGALRLRVRETATGTIVYDNRRDAPELSDAGSALQGGNVTLHLR